MVYLSFNIFYYLVKTCLISVNCWVLVYLIIVGFDLDLMQSLFIKLFFKDVNILWFYSINSYYSYTLSTFLSLTPFRREDKRKCYLLFNISYLRYFNVFSISSTIKVLFFFWFYFGNFFLASAKSEFKSFLVYLLD